MNKKLNEGTAQAILDRVALGERQKDLATEFAVSPATISNLVAGKSWVNLRRDKPTVVRRGSKLTATDIPQILARLQNGETPGDVAADYGITRQAVANIKKGSAWKDVVRPDVPRPARRKVWEADPK